MKKLFIIPLTLLSFSALAQTSMPEVVASSGAFFIGSGFTNSYTVGELALVETYSTGTFMLTQGFQQPADNLIGIAPVATVSGNMNVFPNPGNGLFYLDYNLDENAVVIIEVVDMLGQLVYTDQTNRSNGAQRQAVDLSTQADGVYFVTCTIKTANQITKTTSKITLAR
jgi:Secretion system C-terminal sorting domain